MPYTLGGSVGQGGANNAADVRVVQALLVLANRLVGIPATVLNVDAIVGPLTIGAIKDFQQNHVHGVVDGRVDPGGATLKALNALAAKPLVTVVQPGDATKATPYTIAIVANPALETSTGSGAFVDDPILLDLGRFEQAAQYTCDVLFGRLVGQAEQLLADPAIGPNIRVVTVYDAGRQAADADALVSQFPPNIAEPRRDKFVAFLARYGIAADVAFAITASPTHDRASAWFTSEDTTRGGVGFTLDGVAMTHYYFPSVPGTVALPASSHSMTGLHEFGHASSSFTVGQVVDQYVDGSPGLNNKKGRPIPSKFGTLDAATFGTDPVRDGLGYPAGWQSYHPALTDPAVPSLMDNYWQSPTVPEACVFDTITRRFLRDRLLAKLSRP